MAKKEKSRLEEALHNYLEERFDLLNNPRYTDLSNRKINPLFRANDEKFYDELYKDLNDTIEFFKSEFNLVHAYSFIAKVLDYFKSNDLYQTMLKTIELVPNSELSLSGNEAKERGTSFVISKEFYKTIKKSIKKTW